MKKIILIIVIGLTFVGCSNKENEILKKEVLRLEQIIEQLENPKEVEIISNIDRLEDEYRNRYYFFETQVLDLEKIIVNDKVASEIKVRAYEKLLILGAAEELVSKSLNVLLEKYDIYRVEAQFNIVKDSLGFYNNLTEDEKAIKEEINAAIENI